MNRLASQLIAICASLLLPASMQAAAQAERPPTAATAQPLKVLFIGNSHVFVNDVPGRVRQHLEAGGSPVRIRSITKGGARLIGFSARPRVAAVLREQWDVVVLQEATASFLSAAGRSRFHEAVQWFLARIPKRTRVVLYQTWPWQSGSRYLHKHGGTSPRLWRAMQQEYAKAAAQPRIEIAPVGKCWMKDPHVDTYYSRDGNHASVAGSALAAKVIARTVFQADAVSC